MQVDVPPAFVAFDSKKNQCGALIRWFLEKITSSQDETYIRGGDLCQEQITNFNRKTGKQHNFETVAQIFQDLTLKHPNSQLDWKTFWAKTFVFDALIGNTDRHQDNWGIIVTPPTRKIRIGPAFDNGSSMGYEQLPKKLQKFSISTHLKQYVLNGRHHITWSLEDSTRMEHAAFITKFLEKYPEMTHIMIECLNRVNYQFLKDLLNNLVEFDVSVRLATVRSNFMLELIDFRHQRLLQELNGLKNRAESCKYVLQNIT